MKDAILDFIEDHRKLCIFGIIMVILIAVMFGIRSNNLKKKRLEAQKVASEEAKKNKKSALAQDVEPEAQPTSKYQSSLGLDADKDDGRVEVDIKDVKPTPTKKPVKSEPKYETVVDVYDHTNVPKTNVDGSSCMAYRKGVRLTDFGTFWGSSLTKADYKGGKFYMIGVKQNPEDFCKGDLQSTGWLIEHLSGLKSNDAIKFTNLHVIDRLSDSHVALLCSYDWYSAFGLRDTLVVFEDISNSLNYDDIKNGDIFSATVYRHNVKVETVNGQRVVVCQYATFK